MKTERGFELNHFVDDYGVDCSIQESRAAEAHIWLGVNKPEIKIMYKDAIEAGIKAEKDYPNTNEYGWCTIHLPEKAMIFSRMHLNRKQAKELAKKLKYFAKHGVLKEDENDV